MKRILAGITGLILSAAALAATLNPVQLLNPAGSTAGQAIVSTGASTAPAWGNVTASALSPVAANTVIANPTSGTAAPTAHAVPSCSTANSALKYTSGTGLSCGTTFALTSGDLSQFASTTSAQLAGVISNETGSGALVFGTSPSLTTPNIVGTSTNDNAAAGSVGEYVTNTTLSTAATTNTALNATSASLTAGDWDVTCTVQTAPAGSTTTQYLIAGISTTSATFTVISGSFSNFNQIAAVSTAGTQNNLAAPVTRLSLSATTTAYCVTQVGFSVSTLSVHGFIRARRVR